MKNIFYLSIAVVVFFASSCKRNYDYVATYLKADSSLAYLKIIHASPSFRQVFNKQDSFNVYVDNHKVNSSFLTFNSLYPFSVNQTTNSISSTYFTVAPGQKEIKLVGSVDSATIYTISKNLQAGKLYSLLLTDSIKSTRDSSQIFVQDIIPPAIQGYYNLRFIHAVLNDTAGKTVDVFSYARNTTIGTNLKPGAITNFSLIAYNTGVIDTFYVTRSAGASTPLSARTILAKIPTTAANIGSSSPDKRSYTLYFKGDANLNSGSKARSLAFYINN
jgi:hypothetical protein